ncbi:hypothetical protein WHP92_00335 [Campylobacter jejuni]
MKKSFDIAYVYVVEALCNDYLSERYRIGVFASFDEALDFVAKIFTKAKSLKFLIQENQMILGLLIIMKSKIKVSGIE